MRTPFVLGLLATLAAAGPAMASVPEDRLLEAVKTDDHDAIRSLLAAHADVNAPLPDKSTVLAWAVDRQDEQSVRLLLDAGAKPDVSDVDGAVPLTLACELGDPLIVDALVKAGADAHAVRPDGITALALCSGRSTPEALGALVDKGADVNATDAEGQTALMRAAFAGKTDNITFLVSHGANVNATEQKGFTPLFFALRSKVPGAPMALLNAGADIKAALPDGTSVVAAAVDNGNIAFAVAVVSRGTDLTERDAQGRQLIHVAAASGSADLVKMVLSKGVDANAMSQPPSAPPPAPVQVAALVAGGPKLARADGTRPPAPPAIAKPPLVFAAEAGSAPAMKALVDAGAKVSIKAQDGTTVALAAAGSGNLDAVKYALQLDSDLTYIGPNHRSIMHYAIANKNPDLAIPVLQYLADKGAKLDEKNDKGDTPGDFINRGGQQDIRIFYIQLLKDHGIVSQHDH
jgi:ankyrin repeat protein